MRYAIVALILVSYSHAAEPKWRVMRPLRIVIPGRSSVLDDVLCHIPATSLNPAVSSAQGMYNVNPPTWGHESTHGINANLRNENVGEHPVNAYYITGDRFLIVREPKTTLRRVDGLIPLPLKGRFHQTYFKDALRDWDSRPGYIMDEGVAYLNGAKIAKQLNHEHLSSDTLATVEWSAYGVALLQSVQESDPTSPDREALRGLVEWYINESLTLSVGNPEAVIHWGKITASGLPIRSFLSPATVTRILEVR